MFNVILTIFTVLFNYADNSATVKLLLIFLFTLGNIHTYTHFTSANTVNNNTLLISCSRFVF